MLPIETQIAVFPKAVVVGNVTLRPLTLCHATALEFFGVDVTKECDAGTVYIAAWIISKDSNDIKNILSDEAARIQGMKEWIDGVDVSVSTLIIAVNRIISMAFSTNVPGKATCGECFVGGITGYGWPLEIAEALCHEYSIAFDDALDIPLCRAFGMIACARIRNGGKAGGPDYYERILLKDMKGKDGK